MRLYSTTGDYIVDTETSKHLYQGSNGDIYKYNDELCFKVFKNIGFHEEEMALVLKSLNLKNFYKIIDLLYTGTLEYAGYMTEFYTKIDKDILLDKDYLLDSINNIHDSITELNKRNILINDFHVANAIITDNGIIVCDADDFKHTNKIFASDEITGMDFKNMKEANTYLNNYRFKVFLKNLLYDYLIKTYNPKDPTMGYKLIKRLVDEDSYDLSNFNNTLNKYDKPIEYFNKVL